MQQHLPPVDASNPTERYRMAKYAQLLKLAAVVCAGLVLTSECVVRAGAAQSGADRLKTVLGQMDAASAKFHSAEANVQKLQYDPIVKDTTTETGTIYFLRSKGSMQMGAKFDPPDAQTLEYKNGLLRIYNAGNNQLQQYLCRRAEPGTLRGISDARLRRQRQRPRKGLGDRRSGIGTDERRQQNRAGGEARPGLEGRRRARQLYPHRDLGRPRARCRAEAGGLRTIGTPTQRSTPTSR